MTSKMKVFHNAEDFAEGEELILTLEDKPILDELGELNEDGEEGLLINNELLEKQKAEHSAYIRSNVKKLANVQTAHLDEKFGDVERKALLPHYDERKFEKQGIQLDEEGTYDTEKLQQLDLIKAKLKSKKGIVESLESQSEKQVASEYKQEKVPQKALFKKKKKREVDPKNSLMDFLEEQANEQQEEFVDRKKMKERKKEEEMKSQLIDQKTKRDNYEQALKNSKQELETSKLKWTAAAPTVEEMEIEAGPKADEDNQQQKVKRSKLDEVFWEDDDELLRISIEKERNIKRMQIEKHQESQDAENVLTKEEKLQKLIEENKEIEEDIKKQEEKKKTFAAPQNKGNAKQKSKVIQVNEINFSEDDLKYIATDKNRKNENEFVLKSETKKALKDTQMGTTSVVNVSMPTERLKGKRYHDHIQEEEEFQKKLKEDKTDEEYDKMCKELEEVGLRKENLGVGLSGFLQELQERGALRNDNLDYSGRSLDSKPHEDGTQTLEDERIQLVYRDETGKIMTKKQAFRYQCNKFHGQGPSRNKLEKIKRKELERQKQLTKNLSEDSIIMKNLKLTQKFTMQPFQVLQKKN